ncbi:unnamed protein product [Albugo candida]|uniref:Uncharacterized protein n=1 Tax=Albugo candida TaxID=65357 RepID=A0A024FTQ5_9STRA|nr:unnamed protein product [Albugo candida]|eukprot:CCI10508.1 unnamed protein product [Albugo candida]
MRFSQIHSPLKSLRDYSKPSHRLRQERTSVCTNIDDIKTCLLEHIGAIYMEEMKDIDGFDKSTKCCFTMKTLFQFFFSYHNTHSSTSSTHTRLDNHWIVHTRVDKLPSLFQCSHRTIRPRNDRNIVLDCHRSCSFFTIPPRLAAIISLMEWPIPSWIKSRQVGRHEDGESDASRWFFTILCAATFFCKEHPFL